MITDVGMTGPENSVLGMRTEAVLSRFVAQIPSRFDIASGPEVIISAVVLEIDGATGRSVSIQRIYRHEKI
jgi:calcineurin-like phosphoesterase